MAIADVKEYAHLSEEDMEKLGAEFDAIRTEIEESRGACRRGLHPPADHGPPRDCSSAGRVTLFASGVAIKGWRPAWIAGAALLGVAKILENMEIGHNVMHGQWDWMNDPEIHSRNWEWDTAPAGRAVEALAQLRPPPVHERAGHGQRHRLRHPPDGAGAEVAPGQPRQPDLQRAARRRCSSGASSLHDLDIESIRKRQEGPEGDEAAAQGDQQEVAHARSGRTTSSSRR